MKIQCPSYAYTCAYGACVNGDANCNQKYECADNSDEQNCPYNNMHVMDCVSDDEEKCDSGQCIDSTLMCDGVINCPDNSDESEKRCVATPCPSYAFRCAYGACVSGVAKCNSNIECADGSDEKDCPKTTFNCQLMLNSNLRAFYKTNSAMEIYNEMIIENGVSIIYMCRTGFQLKNQFSNHSKNYCFEGNWAEAVPTCEKTCSAIVEHTVSVTCEYKRSSVSCAGGPIWPGTIASIICKPGYEKPKNRIVHDNIICQENSEWNYSAFHCEMICGKLSSNDKTIGVMDNNTKVPWHVGIYSDLSERQTFVHHCGGTILNERLIVSAAHCFWDVKNSIFFNALRYMVGIGKYYRDYYADEPLSIQQISVLEIKHNQDYIDLDGLYQNDIAILLLSEIIIFRAHVAPICIKQLYNQDKILASGKIGRIAGWGITETGGEPSPILKILDVPSVGHHDCISMAKPEYRQFITNDKLCAGTSDGRSVCQGDSGGGLVFSEDIPSAYYLWGIVSTGANKHKSCENNMLTSFTNIQFYYDFIQSAINNTKKNNNTILHI